MFHHIVYTCFSFALGSSCAWFVASLFFSPENGGFVPVLFWTGCLYLRKLLVWHCIKWSCGKVHLPGLKQISCKQHPFNSSKLWHWRILRELIEIAVGLKLLCIFYWFHPWQCCQMELSKIVLGFCAFLTRAAMQYCDQNGAVQRDVTGVLRWVLTAIIVLYIAVTLTPFKFICRYQTVNYGYNDGVFPWSYDHTWM